MAEARDIENLFALWEQNVETVRSIKPKPWSAPSSENGIASQLVAHLKHCAVALAKRNNASQSIT
jgi:hypothetical protein